MEGKHIKGDGLRSRIIDVEKKLLESERRFRQSVDNSPNPIFSVDRAGIIHLWNQSCEDCLGYTKDISGQHFSRLLWNASDRDELSERIAEVFLGHSFGNVEIIFRTAGSEKRYCITRLYPLLNEQDEVGLCVFTNTDVTEWKYTDEKMKHRLNIERLVSTISSRFVGVYDLDRAINASLRDLGRFSRADRAYLFRYDEDSTVMNNTHEWCAEHVNPQIKNLQGLSFDAFPWWTNKLYQGEYIHIRDVSAMPNEASAEREILEIQQVKSVLVIGFSIQGNVAGFIGFDNVLGNVEWDDGDLALLGTVSEIIGNALERNRAEEKLRSSLNEKEILLREVHHRVKNNLQVVSSLLDLGMLYTEEYKEKRILEDARSKVNTMALIHTHLYKEAQFDTINIARCLNNLIEQLSCLYASAGNIDTLIQTSDVHLNINQAIPCALVINELVSNAYKHAFKDRKSGTIEVSITAVDDGEISILLRDDGVGMPDGIELDSVDSLGLTLVKNLVVNQLKGAISMHRHCGTQYAIQFTHLNDNSFGTQ
jgi:PAS domain S-box-containing protein